MRIRWFPRSWLQLELKGFRAYVDAAWIRSCFEHHPTKVEFSRWPGPIDGLPEELEPADLILITHHHKDQCKRVTVERLRTEATTIIAPAKCRTELGSETQVVLPGDSMRVGPLEVLCDRSSQTRDGARGGVGLLAADSAVLDGERGGVAGSEYPAGRAGHRTTINRDEAVGPFGGKRRDARPGDGGIAIILCGASSAPRGWTSSTRAAATNALADA
jgi:L-ascorbate metabolism protein UlaG (beta-lactamase superfamily)